MQFLLKSQQELGESNKLTLKVTWKHKGSRRAKTILKKKNGRGLTLSNFMSLNYHKAKVIKCGISERKKAYFNRTERPEICGPLIFDKFAKAIQ